MIALNAALAFIMFGIALGIQLIDFKAVFRSPKSISVGLLSQFVLLPSVTALLAWFFAPSAGVALGMILVAACPGGNVSNFISTIGGGNVALSVSLTAFATLMCPLLTPVNFQLWASLVPTTSSELHGFQLSFFDMLSTVLVVLLLPALFGMWVRARRPKLAERIGKPVRWISFLILIAFIWVAIGNNISTFRTHLAAVFLIVLFHNAIAFSLGYASGAIAGLSAKDCRSISIETGIQNSGLGLIVIFTFFGGHGEMALVAAWWGVWHILAGLILASIFRKGKLNLAH